MKTLLQETFTIVELIGLLGRGSKVHGSSYFTVLVNTSLPTSLGTSQTADIIKPKPWPTVDIMLKVDSIPFTTTGERNKSQDHVSLPKRNF